MNVEKSLMKLPMTAYDWCEYKGQVYFALPNYEATVKAKKPMVDLHYCATKAMNNTVLKTVQYDKKKFKPTAKFN